MRGTRRRRWLCSGLLLVFLLVTALPVQAAGSSVGVNINGVPVSFDAGSGSPFLDGAGRTQVPFRRTMETFGCTVTWEGDTRTAVAQKDGITVRVPIGRAYIEADGVPIAIDTTAVLQNGRTYLPIRAVLEAFGAQVTWDGTARQVVVTTGETLLRVHFIDVGQGDAILIDLGPCEVLIDGGTNQAGDALVTYLTPYIDGSLDYLIATHPDADHIGGLDNVLAAFQVDEVIDSGFVKDTKTYTDYWQAVQKEPNCTLTYDENRTLSLGPKTTLTILETGDHWKDANDASVVAQLLCGEISMLFTGDMTETVETACLSLFGPVDVLKVAHHGSRSSTSQAFLDAIDPACAVISYGKNNTYGHPTSQTLGRLLNRGIPVYGTGKSGSLCLTTDGTTYSFNTSQTLTLADAAA